MTSSNDFRKNFYLIIGRKNSSLIVMYPKPLFAAAISQLVPGAWFVTPGAHYLGHLGAHLALVEFGGFIRKSHYQR